MKRILIILLSLCSTLAVAENTNSADPLSVEPLDGSTVTAEAEVDSSDSYFDLPDFSFDSLDLTDFRLKDIYDMKGWTPRYILVSDDNLIGRTHYMGLSYFNRQGAAHEGPSLRVGFGERGEKINLSYSSGFSFMGVDMGLSYLILNKDNLRQHETEIEGFGLEIGLRLWVVQLIAIHMDETSYVSLGYGF